MGLECYSTGLEWVEKRIGTCHRSRRAEQMMCTVVAERGKWVISSRVEQAGLEFMEDTNCSVAHVAFG